MKLRLFVICFGDKHADLYERVAIRSLTQPLNKAALPSDAVVSIYTDAATAERVGKATQALSPNLDVHIMDTSGDHYDVQNRCFIEEIGRCVREDATLLIVNPDCFWGDGSLPNLLAIAGEQDVCIASPHVRVDQNAFLRAVTEVDYWPVVPRYPDINNAALVQIAMRTLHQSWIDADVTKERANTFETGIAIRRISEGFYAVSHLQPTVFLARVNARDYGFFAERQGARGLWDHFWPAELIGAGRYRVVASSDAIFIAELTEADTHNTALHTVDPKKPDAFFRDAPHISANRTVVGIWRS